MRYISTKTGFKKAMQWALIKKSEKTIVKKYHIIFRANS